MQTMALRDKGRLGTHEALQKNAAAYNSGLKVLRDAPNCKRCPGEWVEQGARQKESVLFIDKRAAEAGLDRLTPPRLLSFQSLRHFVASGDA